MNYLTILFTILPLVLSQNNENNLKKCKMTLQMIDATGKIPSGILNGNLVNFGSFDECLAIKFKENNTVIKGKYCLMKFAFSYEEAENRTSIKNWMPKIENRVALLEDATIQEPKLLLGWCIPDSCPVDFYQSQIAIDILGSKINASIKPLYEDGTCQTEDDLQYNLSTLEWITFGFFIFMLGITILSTLYDIYLQQFKKKTPHIILIAFSIKTNGGKLLHISKNSDQLSCLNGLRFISMMWVILGHRYTYAISEPVVNYIYFDKWVNNVESMYIFSAPISVDTFFFLSGLLVCYVFFLAQEKGVKFNIFLYYLHRYLRLTPVFAVVILFYVTLMRYIGSGPIWPLNVASLEDSCKTHWWPALLYISNYYDPSHICVGQSWYLTIDFQLYLLSPLILLPLKKWPKITLLISKVLVIASMVIGAVISFRYDLPGISIFGNKDYQSKYYAVTHTRYGPWLIGLIFGYYIFQIKKDKGSQKIRLHPAYVTVGWIASLAVMLTIIFAPHDLLFSTDWKAHACFNGLHRQAWSFCLCWLIFACIQGYGGPINAFLSWSPFHVLGRLTYTMYLTHIIIQQGFTGRIRTNTYFSDFRTMYDFWGDFCGTLVLALYLSLTFESPMLTIEKIIFKTGSKSKEIQLPNHVKSENK